MHTQYKIRYSVLLRAISVLLINAFFLSSIAWANPLATNSLARWVDPSANVAMRTKLLRESGYIRVALPGTLHEKLLKKHKAQACRLHSNVYLVTPEIEADDEKLLQAVTYLQESDERFYRDGNIEPQLHSKTTVSAEAHVVFAADFGKDTTEVERFIMDLLPDEIITEVKTHVFGSRVSENNVKQYRLSTKTGHSYSFYAKVTGDEEARFVQLAGDRGPPASIFLSELHILFMKAVNGRWLKGFYKRELEQNKWIFKDLGYALRELRGRGVCYNLYEMKHVYVDLENRKVSFIDFEDARRGSQHSESECSWIERRVNSFIDQSYFAGVLGSLDSATRSELKELFREGFYGPSRSLSGTPSTAAPASPVSQAVLAKCKDLQEAVRRGNDDVAIALCRELTEYCATHRDALKKTQIVKEKVVPALLATLRVGGREGSSVRAPAIGALGATAGYIKDELELIEKVVRALMKRVFIGDPLEQPAARGALVRFKRSAIPFLTDELDNEKNRRSALQTLVEMGKPAVDPLFTYLKDSKWELQLAVAQDLFSIDRSGGDNNVSLFIENLALLGFLTPISSEKLALYNNSPYNKCPHMRVRIEENVDKAGDAFAAEILDGLQFWFEKLKIDRHPERRVGIQLCTGDSPFGGYRKVGGDAFMESLQDTNRYDPEKIRELREQYKRVAGILDSWETPRTQAFLREHGLDSRLKPDMSKVTAFAVDAIFPQRSFDDKNADYFAFAHLLNNVCDLWGIPEENRNFFHGDVHVTQKDGEWRTEGIDDAEYAKIVESVDKEGLKMLEFQAACLLAGEKNGFSFNTPLRVKQGKVVGYVLRRDNENEDFRVEQVEIEPLKPEHAQYGYLQDMRNQAIMMHEKLVEFGGAHITLLGLGPSSDGKGHIGFCEEGTPPEQTCFISEIHDYDATFHVSGAHAKEVYGFKNMFVTVDGVRRPRFGFITYAPFEFMYRGSRPRTGFTKRNIENEVKVIVIATGNAKSHSIVKAIEGEIDPNFPLSYVQRSRGVFVLDRAAARELAIFRNSWEFHRFPKTSWTMENIRRYFIEFAQLLKCKLAAIDYKAPIAIDSWRRQLGQASEGMRQIIKNRLRNIINLIGFVYETEGKPLKKAQDVINDIESCVIRPGEIMKKLEERWGLKRGDKILADSPHMDDEFLAMMHPLKVLAENCPISAYYNSYGYTAVYSEYVLALLDIASQFSGEEMMALSDDTREELFRALVDEQHTFKPIPHLDYEVLPYMSEREKMLRAKILLLDLNERRDIKDENDRKRAKNKFRTPEQVKQLGNFLAEVNSRKPRNGGKDLDIMCYAKTSIRYMEAASALMYLGISFSEVHWPLDIAYGDLGRGQTLSRKDINKIKKVIGEEPPGGPPKAIIFNGEGFPDFGGHSNTEMGVYIALFELLEEGKISPDILLIQWAGVWDRISVESSHLSVVLTAEELRDFADSFTYFYRGQAPYAPVLNASSAEPQSFANDVIEASRASVQEMLSLVDLSPDLRDILNRGGGILHYKVRKLSDPAVRHEFRMKTEELLKAGLGTSLSSSKSLMGDQPYPERLHELPGELVDKMLAAEAISEKEKKLFEGKNSPRIATNSVSDISGKASGGIKIDVDQSLSLLNKYIPAKLNKGEVYEIRYNKTKFDEYQMNAGLSSKENSPRALLQEYIDLLRVRAPKGSIKIIPCSRDDRPLISVSRYASKGSAEPLGEGSVNMKGDIRGQPLRIIGMLNMAFAASHIPNDASPAEMHKYTSLLDLIKNQYKSITGKELTAENLLKAIRRITLQATKPIPVQILEEYYRLTIEQLREAA